MQAIKHLHWRAGFGLSPSEWQERRSWSTDRAIDKLFSQAKKAGQINVPDTNLLKNPKEVSDKERQEIQKQERFRVFDITAEWVARMANPEESALLEKMSLFWHGHFACRSVLGKLAGQQLLAIRTHALGSFRELLLAIARDPAMIRYLNNQQNRKQQPNENFARELMELFTLGRGHYTEQDIKEAARAFTGWSSDRNADYIFRKNWHDEGTKTIFGKSGRFGGEDVIDLILEQKQTARFIAGKVYRYFASETPNDQRIEELATAFYDSGYNTEAMLRKLFAADWFYGKDVTGQQIKSPTILVAGLMRTLNLQFTESRQLIRLQSALGQRLFDPPNVAGWPGGQAWIDNATLMTRVNLPYVLAGGAQMMVRDKDALEAQNRDKGVGAFKTKLNLQPLQHMLKGQSESEILNELADYLLPGTPSVDIQKIGQFVFGKDSAKMVTQASLRLLSLPDYQLC